MDNSAKYTVSFAYHDISTVRSKTNNIGPQNCMVLKCTINTITINRVSPVAIFTTGASENLIAIASSWSSQNLIKILTGSDQLKRMFQFVSSDHKPLLQHICKEMSATLTTASTFSTVVGSV